MSWPDAVGLGIILAAVVGGLVAFIHLTMGKDYDE